MVLAWRHRLNPLHCGLEMLAPPSSAVKRDFSGFFPINASMRVSVAQSNFRRTRHSIDVEALPRVMVLNRLCDPDSKVGVLRWLETIALPGFAVEAIEHHHLLRAVDAVIEHQQEVDHVLAGLLRPMVDQDLAVVFYDMTTIRAAGLSQQDKEVRQFGMDKEGIIARQVMLGVVQTADGLPLYHEVFDGNTALQAAGNAAARRLWKTEITVIFDWLLSLRSRFFEVPSHLKVRGGILMIRSE